jgi:phosphatidylglycerol:prolipoprotein diacylglycerol transferase
LQNAGTFPHWPEGTVQGGEGAEAWVRHVQLGWIAPDAAASLPVHPTQLYEAAVGAALVVFLLWLRRRQTFRGQIFLAFTFAYGFARFCLEFLRDDVQRGEIPPALPAHVLFPLAFAVFGGAFALGIAPSLERRAVRLGSMVALAAPVVVAYLALRPAEFVAPQPTKLSTSQLIGLVSAALAAWGFGVMWKNAKRNPEGAMGVPVWREEEEGEKKEEEEDSGTGTGTGTATGETESEKAESGSGSGESEKAESGPGTGGKPVLKKKKKKKVSS